MKGETKRCVGWKGGKRCRKGEERETERNFGDEKEECRSVWVRAVVASAERSLACPVGLKWILQAKMSSSYDF